MINEEMIFNNDFNDDLNDGLDGDQDEEEDDDEGEGEGEGSSDSEDTLRVNGNRTGSVSFDTSLPGQHSYLGHNLEELSGRVVLDEDTLVTLPLISFPGVVLVPGQRLPLHLRHPRLVAIMKHIIDKDRTFGLTFGTTLFGTTAEVRSVGNNEDDADDGLTPLKVLAEGRQRFIVKETWRTTDSTLMAKVEILPEVEVTNPLNTNCLQLSTGFKHNSSLLPACSRWPSWVYRLYEAESLMERIKRHLENWVAFESRGEKPQGVVQTQATQVTEGTTSQGTAVRTTRTITTTLRTTTDEEEEEDDEDMSTGSIAPSQPREFSYWVAANLPLHDSHRIEFLSLNCPIQRLRWLLSVLQKYIYLCCVHCKSRIAHRDDVFSMSAEGPQGQYVNPGGHVHETLTLMKAQSITLTGYPSTESSWFPGYAWTIADCTRCENQMGWKFTATDKKLKPQYFWGIRRNAIELALKLDIEDVLWKPII